MGFPWAKVDNKKRADHYKNQPDFYNTIYNGCLTIAGQQELCLLYHFTSSIILHTIVDDDELTVLNYLCHMIFWCSNSRNVRYL